VLVKINLKHTEGTSQTRCKANTGEGEGKQQEWWKDGTVPVPERTIPNQKQSPPSKNIYYCIKQEKKKQLPQN